MDNIETYGKQAAFASLREPAWHMLGTVFQQEVSTSEMLRLAHLADWDVRLEPIAFPEDYRVAASAFATLRTNPFDGGTDVLGIVGERYTVFQNEDMFSFGDNLLDGGRWETAGSIKQGRVVFASLALNHEVVLDPSGVSDKIDSYLLLSTSHDGSTALQAAVTPVRVVCQNTLTMGLRQAKQTFKIRHTQSVAGKVQAARDALGLANDYLHAFEKEAAALYATSVTDMPFDAIMQAAYPKPDSKAGMTRWLQKQDLVRDIYNSKTTYMLKGTKWGVLNAMTERMDWFKQVRKGNTDNAYAAASGFDPVTASEKQRLFALVSAF